jgi:hypothetical protein
MRILTKQQHTVYTQRKEQQMVFYCSWALISKRSYCCWVEGKKKKGVNKDFCPLSVYLPLTNYQSLTDRFQVLFRRGAPVVKNEEKPNKISPFADWPEEIGTILAYIPWTEWRGAEWSSVSLCPMSRWGAGTAFTSPGTLSFPQFVSVF